MFVECEVEQLARTNPAIATNMNFFINLISAFIVFVNRIDFAIVHLFFAKRIGSKC